ncbi:MAG: helix-turn-helix domain-containing protein [Lachnospiraceae bacterium]
MKKEIKIEDKQKLFVINLERILAEKGMKKRDLADKLHCTPQTITNYCKRGVSEQQVAEIAKVLEISEKELYRTEAENEFYALKKIDLQKAILATHKGRMCMLAGFSFLVFIMKFYGGIESLFATLIMLLFFEVVGAVNSNKLIDRIFRVAMRIVEGLAVFCILIYPFLKG